MTRRSYGTGSLFTRIDGNGQETWYGKWRDGGRQVKRKIGQKRQPGGRDGLTGKQAEVELRKLMIEASASPPFRPGEQLTVRELADRYIADLERRGRKPSTVTAVRSAVDVHLAPFFDGRTAQSVTPADVTGLLVKMEGAKLSPKSIRNYVGTLSAIYRFGQRKHVLRENPAAHVELPEKVSYSNDIRFLEPDEVDALARNARPGMFEAVDRAMYVTAAMTGLRQGELIALRWRDVDWTAQKVRVRRNYVRGEFGTPKSRRSERSVPMADRVAGELDRLFKASACQDDDDLVFAHPLTRGPLERAGVLRRFRHALKAGRLDSAHRFHDLRHTFGTRMAATGVAMRTLQEWMGHRDIQTTQIYADYAPGAHEADLIEAAFGRGTNAGNNLSESESTSDDLKPTNTGVEDLS